MIGAKIWKRILNEGLNYAEDADGVTESEIIKMPIIVDQQVDAGGWDILIDNLSLPFPKFWIEGESLSDEGEVRKWGGTVDSSRLASGGWSGTFNAVVEDRRCKPVMIGKIEFILDDCGSLVFTSDATNYAKIPSDVTPIHAKTINKSLDRDIENFRARVCRVLMLLGCTNISLQSEVIDPTQAKRASKRFGGDPDSYRYHMLVVRPAGSKPSTPGEPIGNTPWHMCRGHFAEYGPQFKKGLLFGKLAGRFYITPHVKGDKKNGIVEKDYAIPA